MISLEQVKLLESKVTKTIDYVKKVTEENTVLRKKLDSYQKRIEELEVLIRQFKEEQSKIESGILAALDRLNQFEDALESKLSGESKASPKTKVPAESKAQAEIKVAVETPLPKETGVPQHASVSDKETAEDIPELSSEDCKDEEDITELAGGELDIF
jgi:TolA-binding protein